MNINEILPDDNLLTREEEVIMRLRALYKQHGYAQYKTSRFEEYTLYTEHKAFLPSGDIITFTGANGKLMALRPDVTLSIVRDISRSTILRDINNSTTSNNECRGVTSRAQKLYYNENVYRSDGNEFKEQMQIGLECIGNIDIKQAGEVLWLASCSLEALSKMIGFDAENPKWHLDISHMGYINSLLNYPYNKDGDSKLSSAHKNELLKYISEKNGAEITKFCAKHGLPREFHSAISNLTEIYSPISETIDKLKEQSISAESDIAITELEALLDVLKEFGIEQNLYLDFTIVNDISYYDGLIFQGFIEGIPRKVISGGRYDMLLRKFNISSGAIGFAVYLDLISAFIDESGNRKASQSNEIINIALPKGRLGEKAYAILEEAGYSAPGINEESRRLIFETSDMKVRYFWVKPSDVAIYVERGVADAGIVGKDILLEQSPDVYELSEMGIGYCKICVAGKKGTEILLTNAKLRVATIFPNIARDYFEKQGRDIEIIKLHGSIEIAPILDLCDVIVDIVETGKTLRENDLEPIETITDISARLIANKVSYKFKQNAIKGLIEDIAND